MAVCAANDTFFDLRLQDPQAHRVENKLSDGFALSAGNVIELEYGDVAFTAINTRMCGEEVDHEELVAEAITRDVPPPMQAILFSVTGIVCARVNSETFAADMVATARRCITDTEQIRGLSDRTLPTYNHRPMIARRTAICLAHSCK